MNNCFISISAATYLSVEKVTAVFPNIKSEPLKRIIEERRSRGMVLDMTVGKKTRSAILTSDGYIFLSPKQPKTIIKNIVDHSKLGDDEEDEEVEE